MTYIIDTNALISAWYENYPLNNFPVLWENLAQLVQDSRLKILKPVADEIKDRSQGLRKWIDNLRKHIISVDQQLQDAQEEIIRPYANRPELIAKFSGADPNLVAYALLHGGTVITQEKVEEGRVKIPSACTERNIDCRHFIYIVQSENWVFR